MIEVSHITKSFGKITAVDDFTLDINRGSVLGIVGSNGGGKSTLLRLMAGVFDADKGVTENLVIKWSRDSKSIDIIPFDGAMGEETYDVSLFVSGKDSGVNMGMIKVDDDTYYAIVDDLDNGDYTAVVNNNGKDSEESQFGVYGDDSATSFIVKYSAKTNKLDVEAISFESAEAVIAVKNTETGKTIMRELKVTDSGNFAGLADTSEGTYEISVMTKDGVVDTFTTTNTTQSETFVELNPTTSQVTYLSM